MEDRVGLLFLGDWGLLLKRRKRKDVGLSFIVAMRHQSNPPPPPLLRDYAHSHPKAHHKTTLFPKQ